MKCSLKMNPLPAWVSSLCYKHCQISDSINIISSTMHEEEFYLQICMSKHRFIFKMCFKMYEIYTFIIKKTARGSR